MGSVEPAVTEDGRLCARWATAVVVPPECDMYVRLFGPEAAVTHKLPSSLAARRRRAGDAKLPAARVDDFLGTEDTLYIKLYNNGLREDSVLCTSAPFRLSRDSDDEGALRIVELNEQDERAAREDFDPGELAKALEALQKNKESAILFLQNVCIGLYWFAC